MLNEQQRHAINRAAELNRCVNTLGWKLILEIAESCVKESESKVLSCEDETLIIGLQRKAQAAREFLTQFTNRVTSATKVDVTEPESFISVVM